MNLQTLESELDTVTNKIKKLEGVEYASDRVSKSFHLGKVGGSGRNVSKLNRQRDRDLEKTIDNAKKLTELYKEQGYLQRQIEFIKTDGPAKLEAKKKSVAEVKAEYWRQIKVGDLVPLFTGNEVKVVKKNKKSFVSEGGTSWSATEIIGSDAAKLL